MLDYPEQLDSDELEELKKLQLSDEELEALDLLQE